MKKISTLKIICIQRSIIYALAFILSATLINAQNNYWTQQFGAKSSLMGGSVVGGVRDNSAIFYNPGCIGFIDAPTLSINANVYGIESAVFKNGAGNNLNMSSLRFALYPQLISGLITFKKVPKLKMVYGLMTRYRSDYKMLAKHSEFVDVIPEEPGNEFYYGNINYEINSISQWGGVALSYKFNKWFSAGFTQFINYIHLDERLSINTSADVQKLNGSLYTTKASESSVSIIDAISLNWKLGVAFDFGKFKFGITGTIPSVDILGFARLNRNIEYFNQNQYLPDTLIVGMHNNLLVSEEQTGLNARYRYPGSIAAGFEFNFPKTRTRITATVEYFFPIDEYIVARYDSAVPVRPIGWFGGQSIQGFLEERSSSAGVLNGGIGLEQGIGKKMEFYFGARTDFNNTIDFFNTTQPYRANWLNPTFWHYLHFSSGITYHKGSSDISVGINYGLGLTNNTRQPFNLTDPSVQVFNNGTMMTIQGSRSNTMEAQVHNFSIILGYTYYLKR